MEILPVVPADRDVIARLWTSLTGEEVSAETLRTWGEQRPELRRQRRVVTLDGIVVGFSGAVVHDAICSFRVVVDPSARRCGLGSALLEDVEAYARGEGATSMRTHTREDEAEGFAIARGFRVISRVVGWRRTLSSLPPIEPPPPEIDVASLVDAPDEGALFDAVHRMRVHEEGWEREDFDARVLGRGAHRSLQWMAFHRDRIVGVACLEVVPGTRLAWHGLTAVDPEWRKRGIARALKTRQLHAAFAAGLERVETSNEEANVAALALNATLGYEKTAIGRELTRSMRA